jgi:hypothetical protein
LQDSKEPGKQELVRLLRRAADALEDRDRAERLASKAHQQLFDHNWLSSWQDTMDSIDQGGDE